MSVAPMTSVARLTSTKPPSLLPVNGSVPVVEPGTVDPSPVIGTVVEPSGPNVVVVVVEPNSVDGDTAMLVVVV
jgi:hypothetical protein